MKIEQQATVLFSSDVAANRAFFVDLLGFEVLIDIGWFASLKHPGTGALLDLWHRGHSSAPREGVGPASGFVLAFVVSDVADAETRFAKAGARMVEAMRDEPWGQRHFIAASPDGVLLDVVQRIPPSPKWLAENGLA